MPTEATQDLRWLAERIKLEKAMEAKFESYDRQMQILRYRLAQLETQLEGAAK